MAAFLASYARRFLPLKALPLLLVCLAPWPLWIKGVGIAFGVAATMVEHYVEWVVLPRRWRAKRAATESPSTSETSTDDGTQPG